MNKMNIPLLQFAAGLMSPGQYGSFGGAMSRGLMGYTQGLQQQRENDMAEQRLGLLKASQDRQNALADMQMSEYQRRRELADETASNRKSIMTGLLNNNAASPDDPLASQINNGLLRHDMPSNPMIDPGRVRSAQLGLMAMGDTEGASQIGGMFAQPDVDTVTINGRLVNKRTGEVIGEYAPQVNPLDVLNRDIVMGPDGPMVNPYKQQAALERAKASATRIGINSGKLETEEQKERGKANVQFANSIRELANSSRKMLPQYDIMLREIESGKFSTGVGAEWRAGAAKLLGFMGIPKAQEAAASAESFQSAVMNAVMEKQIAQKGPQTESDARRLEQTMASLGNTPEANKFIVKVAKALAKRDIAQADFFRRYWDQNKTYEGAEQAWYDGEGGKSIFDEIGGSTAQTQFQGFSAKRLQ